MEFVASFCKLNQSKKFNRKFLLAVGPKIKLLLTDPKQKGNSGIKLRSRLIFLETTKQCSCNQDTVFLPLLGGKSFLNRKNH